jgi:hypothetical protein
MSEYFVRMKYFDYFIEHLIEGRACVEGPRGFKHYDMLYRAVCLGEVMDIDADPGPYYPFVLIAHYFWRRGDVCRACVFLEKARGRRPFHYDDDEKTAVELLKAAIREGPGGVRRIKTEDSHWSWASLFKDLLIAELDASAKASALRRIKPALKEVFEAADVPDFVAEAHNIFQPYLSITPYIYIYYAVTELEKQEPPRRGARDVLRDIIRRAVSGKIRPNPGSSHVCTPLESPHPTR